MRFMTLSRWPILVCQIQNEYWTLGPAGEGDRANNLRSLRSELDCVLAPNKGWRIRFVAAVM